MTLARIVAAAGLVLMLPLLFLFGTSGLVAPWYAVLGFLILWVALLVAGVRWFKTRPYAVVALPFVGFAVWYGILMFGDAVLGWTA